MKILVIGSKGNMGRRYMAILKYLGIDHVGVDQGDLWPDDFDKAIVCTPTDTHYDMCVALIGRGKPFLCEKPVSKDLRQVEDLERLCREQGVDGYMVCNWSYCREIDNLRPNVNTIDYNCYNTGRDGTAWDCIQLIYLATPDNILIKTDSPKFTVSINKEPVLREIIDITYIMMIEDFCNYGEQCQYYDVYSKSRYMGVNDGNKRLWTMTDAVAATKKVLKYMEEHNDNT